MMNGYLSTLLLAAWFMLGPCHIVWGQWLVPNNSFEVYGACPDDHLDNSELSIPPWMNGNLASCDYFHPCGTGGATVPDNWAGFEFPVDGNAYAGLTIKSNGGFDFREYLQTILTNPLIAGVTYHVSFYVSLGENFCASTRMGAYLSVSPPPVNGTAYLDVEPQIEYPFGYINSDGWTLVSGCFVAQGGELYITIGNFYPDNETIIDPSCIHNDNDSYYFVDYVMVEDGPPAEVWPLDIGDFVSSCPPYVIDPNQGGTVGYIWSDGSHNPTLDVIESGTYALTITDGCNYGIDDVEVNIEGTFDNVDIGPSEITLCQGDSYQINLDPQWVYTWQDGSGDPQYVITEPGTYSVEMYDGCDVQTDTMVVDVLTPPAPFSLGIDSHLCAGDVIMYNFDNALGDFEWQDGSTAANYVITTGGTYALTISNACFETSDEIYVDYILPPVLELGNDLFFCQGDDLTISVDPSQGNYTWQDGSTDTDYVISSEGTYSVTVTNICGTDDDNIYIEEYIEPSFSLGPDITLCPAQLPYLLDGNNITDATSLLWQDGSIDEFYSVSAPGTYSLTASNVCFTTQDVILIEVDDSTPTVALPDDTNLCDGDSLLLTNTGSTGDYTWNDNTQGDSLWVYDSGTYSLTVTSACGIGSDTVVITDVPELTLPDLGPDFALCPGAQAVLQIDIQDVSLQWQDGSTADTLLITSPGMYHVTVTNQCGAFATDTVVVAASNAPPAVDLIDQLQLCQGNTAVIESNISGVSYQWSDGSQLETLQVNSPGTYGLTVTNSCGSDADTVIVTDGGPAPLVDLGPDFSICPAETYTLTPAFSNIDAWQWSDGSSGPSLAISDAGMFSIEATNGCGYTTDTVLVSLLPDVPVLILGNDTVICPGDQIALSIGIPGVSIEWSDGSDGNVFNITSAGTYYATISNVCNTSSDTLRVDALPAAPVLDLGNDQLLCIGETITIDASLPGVSYLWHDGSMGSSFITTQGGIFAVTVSNSCGSDDDSITITETTEGPQVDLGDDVIGCVGSALIIEAATLGVQYLWQDGSTASSFTATGNGVIAVTVSNNCGSDADSIVATFLEIPQVDLGTDTTVCKNDVLTLSVDSVPWTNYTWQDGSNGTNVNVIAPGQYILQATNQCGSHIDSILVSHIDVPPPFSIGNDTSICPGEQLMLSAPVTNYTYMWQDGTTDPAMIADATQLYSLAITNQCGTTRDELQLTIDTLKPIIAIDPVVLLCPESIVTLDAGQSFAAQYNWNNGETTASIDIDLPGEYAVTVVTSCNETSGVIEVVADDCFPDTDFYIPNIFSPNGDGVNDVFEISFNAAALVTRVEGAVYDRWGNLIFASNTNPFTWNGEFRQHSVNPGVYLYRIAVTYETLQGLHTEVVTGDVTVVR